ncbi:MAG: helix-turn-helix transcriptional regulator [Chloroflexia bacterium]|nr:helix-turn-helix transcriptional regulator [Chloroflexia bacterium]
MKSGERLAMPMVDGWHLDGLRLERFRHPAGPREPIAPHAHDEYQFGLSLDTASEYRYRDGRHDVAAGAIGAVQAGEVHAGGDFGDEGPKTTRFLYVSPSVMHGVIAEIDGGCSGEPYFREPAIRDLELAERYLAVFAAFWSGQGSRLERDEALLGILLALVVRHGGGRDGHRPVGHEPRAVALVRDYLDANPVAPVALADLARLAGLSPAYLCRSFAASVGLSPHRYQIQRRVVRVKQLLAQGVPVAEAAKATGFADQSHLGRHFRRLSGVSPGRYRAGLGDGGFMDS